MLLMATMELAVREVPRPALFLAGKAQVLPDFFIGAHAAVEG